MDPFYVALMLFRNRKYNECIEKCEKIDSGNEYFDKIKILKMRAYVAKVKFDELDEEWIKNPKEEEGKLNVLWDESMATAPRPGTSLKKSIGPATAFNRPDTNVRTARGIGTSRGFTSKTPGTSRAFARTPATARALLATAQNRAARLGTASVPQTFVETSKLNLQKCAQDKELGKNLFQYLFHYEGDFRNALELANYAIQATNFCDWWWKLSLSRCYMALGLLREAEQQARSASLQSRRLDVALLLAHTYRYLDQPVSALEVCRIAERSAPGDTILLTEQARILEAMGDRQQSVKLYRNVITQDAMNLEALGAIAMEHFYNDQPEIALRYYRRVLAMGGYSTEVFINLGLCCYRSQHWDLTLTCFRRALLLTNSEKILPDLWYNLSCLAIGIGDINLAMQCLRLCIGIDTGHSAALNNLGVLELKRKQKKMAKIFFTAALIANPDLQEVKNNIQLV